MQPTVTFACEALDMSSGRRCVRVLWTVAGWPLLHSAGVSVHGDAACGPARHCTNSISELCSVDGGGIPLCSDSGGVCTGTCMSMGMWSGWPAIELPPNDEEPSSSTGLGGFSHGHCASLPALLIAGPVGSTRAPNSSSHSSTTLCTAVVASLSSPTSYLLPPTPLVRRCPPGPCAAFRRVVVHGTLFLTLQWRPCVRHDPFG